MFRLGFMGVLLLVVTSVGAQPKWSLDKAHSSVAFQAENIVVVGQPVQEAKDYPIVGVTTGSFQEFDIKLVQGKENFSNSKVDVKIEVNSLETGNSFRDAHLRSEDFFHANKYPLITFKSKSFKKIDDQHFVIVGDLTMRGVTKTIELDAILTEDPVEEEDYVSFSASGVINRFDYGLRWSELIEQGGFRVSNYIKLNIQANFVNTAKS